MLTVVIPVKNMEKYIKKCIDSVLKSKNLSFEIIVVDFGSTDNTINIIYKHYNKNNNVKLYCSDCKNVCDSRNFGIEKSIFKYITFLDADDWVDEYYYSEILNKMIVNKSDIGFSDFKNVKEIDGLCTYQTAFGKILNADFISTGKLLKYIIKNKINCEAWNKIYLKENIVKYNIKFDDIHGVNGEDLLFNFIYFSKPFIATYSKGSFYNHLLRNNSLGSFKNNLTLRFIHIIEELEKEKYNNCIKSNISILFCNLMLQDLNKQTEISSFIENMHIYSKYKNYNKYIFETIFSKMVTFKRKILVLLLYIKQYKTVYNLQKRKRG